MSEDLESLKERFERAGDSRLFAPLADAYRKYGDTAKAIELLEQGIEKFPRYASARVILGKCYYDTGATERAKAEFTRVLDIDPENMVALKYLGDISLAEDRRRDAVGFFRRLLAADPTNEDAARALREAEQPAIVKEIDLADAKATRDERPRELATMTLAGIYASQGYYNKALGIYRDILEREPSNREAREMVEKLRAMLEAGESGEGRSFDEPPLSITLEEVAERLAAATAGHGGADAGEKIESPRDESGEPSESALAGAGGRESVPEPALRPERPVEAAGVPASDGRPVEPPEADDDPSMEQFNSWLKRLRGR